MKHLTKFQRGWNGDTETCQNPLFQEYFWGFLGYLMDKKGPNITKLEKLY